MEWLALNILTVGLTSLIAPSAVRLLWKRSLNKVTAIVIIVLNTLGMVVIWAAVRAYLINGDVSRQSRGGIYIMYGVGIAALVSWGILTTSTDPLTKRIPTLRYKNLNSRRGDAFFAPNVVRQNIERNRARQLL